MGTQAQAYLDRVSEQLILDGYRSWSKGLITGNVSLWNDVWNMFAVQLGTRNGKLALDALSNFTRTLERCSSCPRKTNHAGCNFLVRDEVLILGLISGIQHDDETTIAICLDELSCPSRCDEILIAAEILAVTFRGLERVLLPIPASTIKAILADGVSTATLQ